MQQRFVLFLVLSFAIILGWGHLMQQFAPRGQQRQQPPPEVAEGPQEAPAVEAEAPAPEQPPAAEPQPHLEPAAAEQQPAKPILEEEVFPRKWISLGSADPAAPYRMLVTLSSQGAAVARIELNSPHYRDLEARSQPLEIIRPEGSDRLSFLLTLQKLDQSELTPGEAAELVEPGAELDGVDLWNRDWEVVAANQQRVRFRRTVLSAGRRALEITKNYTLAKVPNDSIKDPNYPAYHLVLDVAIRNVDSEVHEVAYQFDGPTGLPTEGDWYTYKTSRAWGAAGLRDVVIARHNMKTMMVNCSKIAAGDAGVVWRDNPVTFLAVDAHYFSSAVVPRKDDPADVWFADSHPLRVGPVEPKNQKMTNVSVRMISKPEKIEPGAKLSRSFLLYAGPKKPRLLSRPDYGRYRLGELVYYGWFGLLAQPMSVVLHFFHFIIPNYGLAIILLTVLVRGLMFPLSRKQAMNALKMQELQPEIKKIHEKHKKDMEAKTKAQQDLFRQHNYNPLGGCLVLFIQLPIFVALYRSLMVDIELRQAPLIPGDWFRWCSNLAAPDMLFRWDGFMPGLVVGWLGPYFNLLPILTIVLFILQQKMFMPPPADDQAAMQQKVMKFMMIFMGVLFFRVPSGLCIYFIASSMWGLAERKFLPKPTAGGAPAATSAKTPQESESTSPAKSRILSSSTAAAASRDGAAARRKKIKKSKRGKR